jgi:hypothetical protein
MLRISVHQRVWENEDSMNSRFALAMGAYAALAVLGALTLTDEKIRGALWIFLGGLALKTMLAHAARKSGD